MNFGLGWKPSLPDHRDLKLGVKFGVEELPSKVDFRSEIWFSPYNQGTMNSCTAHAGSVLMRMVNRKQGLPFDHPSRMFMYWVTRWLENNTDRDDGATMRAVMKAMAKYGVPDEANWGYNKTTLYTKPPSSLYKEAVQNMVKTYMRVEPSLYELKDCLADGYPFVFGILTYDSFVSQEVAKTGIVPMPTRQESVLGGHAVACVGYDDEKKHFIVLNSWGPGWGDNGYFYLPYQFVTEGLALDFFTIRQMEGIDENRIWKAIE